MMTDRQLIERFLELQEHAEQMTDEQFLLWQADKSERQQALNDPEMHELLEQMAFTKRSFKNLELQSESPNAEAEWKVFASKHYSDGKLTHDHSLFGVMRFSKIAATFIGVILAVGVSFATIHMIKMANSPKPQTVQKEQPVSSKRTASLSADTVENDSIVTMESIVFDNVPLEKILTEIADYYHVELSVQNDDVRQLRFYFIWKQNDSLQEVIEKLNMFEQVNLTIENGKLIAR